MDKEVKIKISTTADTSGVSKTADGFDALSHSTSKAKEGIDLTAHSVQAFLGLQAIFSMAVAPLKQHSTTKPLS